jgi:hypothetical protein
MGPGASVRRMWNVAGVSGRKEFGDAGIDSSGDIVLSTIDYR